MLEASLVRFAQSVPLLVSLLFFVVGDDLTKGDMVGSGEADCESEECEPLLSLALPSDNVTTDSIDIIAFLSDDLCEAVSEPASGTDPLLLAANRGCDAAAAPAVPAVSMSPGARRGLKGARGQERARGDKVRGANWLSEFLPTRPPTPHATSPCAGCQLGHTGRRGELGLLGGS